MDKTACFYLGYITKPHGKNGEVSFFFDTTHPNEYLNLDVIYLDIDGLLTPFFISSMHLNNKGLGIITFEEINSLNKAKELVKKEAYLPLSLLPELDDIHFYDYEVVGFTVVDENYGEVGELKQVIDYKINPLLQVFHTESTKEILIPLHDGVVQRVDRANQRLHVKTVDGLIDLYLNED